MAAFMPYELEVIRRMTAGELSPSTIRDIASADELDSFEDTGVGYFAELSHPDIPRNRVVCGEPHLTAECDGVRAGFVIFLENSVLTLECYSFGTESILSSFRTGAVRVVDA